MAHHEKARSARHRRNRNRCPAHRTRGPSEGSKWADIRVVTHTGETLADHRQYTEWVKVKTSVDADCFGPSNPSTGDTYKVKEPTVLGTLIDASKIDDDLKPLMITDGFVDDGFGFGVCDIGGLETEGFSYWYSR